MKATLYTLVALVAFAANSLLCRMALAQGYIDAWNFTIIRLVSGAVCLGLIMAVYTYNLKRKGALNNAILSDNQCRHHRIVYHFGTTAQINKT